MENERLKRLAARLITEGLRRSAAIKEEGVRERRLADLMPKADREALRISAAGKIQRAARIRQLCGRLAAAHGIGPKRTGRGLQPRPALMKKVTMAKKEVAYER